MSHKKARPNTLANMAGILMAVGVIAGASLSVVNKLTEGPRAATEKAKKLASIKNALPEFDNNPSASVRRFLVDNSETIRELAAGEAVDEKEKFRVCEVTAATQKGKAVGYSISTFTEKGYSGKFTLMVGLDKDGLISSITVLENKETPGLGTRMDEPEFKDPFKGHRAPFTVNKDGGDINAITGATISSRAFCDAVNRAYRVFALFSPQGAAPATCAAAACPSGSDPATCTPSASCPVTSCPPEAKK